MIYYINESYDSKSINEYNMHIDNIIHEYNMSILEEKYSFICENGYEMPINEAEEQKQGFFKKMIERIKIALKNLCDKAITKLNNFMNNHPNSKINGFIQKIRDLFKKASNKLDNAKSQEEAKSIADDAKEEVKNTVEEVELPYLKEYKKYVDSGKFNNKQLNQIKNGLIYEVDVSKYADPKFDHNQMREIYRGLKSHLDVDTYADFTYTSEKMNCIRNVLLKYKMGDLNDYQSDMAVYYIKNDILDKSIYASRLINGINLSKEEIDKIKKDIENDPYKLRW